MPTDAPVVLVTGAAQRIGAAIARKFHHNDYRVIVHYRHSQEDAQALISECNGQRAQSAACLQADFSQSDQVRQLAKDALAQFGRLDVLVNNASSFYPTPFGNIAQQSWDALFDSNLRAAFFLSQALAPELTQRHGAIVNLVDTHADQPLLQHSVYCIAKAGVKAMTKSLALELAPAVRVNGVAPGAILWPAALADDLDPAVLETRQKILNQIPLGHIGDPEQIADAVYFLAAEASYMTGTVLRIDGGRALTL